MSSAEDAFAKGDWIVHSYYGIGRVKKIEKKRVNGTEQKFYRVVSQDTTYWLPLERAGESHVRALANRTTLRRALRLLTKEPTEMDNNFKTRQKRIREVLANGKLRALIRLVRDLWARGQENKLSMTEVGALRQAMDHLTDEVAVSEGISDEDALSKLTDLLDEQEIEPKKGSSTGLVEQLLRRIS